MIHPVESQGLPLNRPWRPTHAQGESPYAVLGPKVPHRRFVRSSNLLSFCFKHFAGAVSRTMLSVHALKGRGPVETSPGKVGFVLGESHFGMDQIMIMI